MSSRKNCANSTLLRRLHPVNKDAELTTTKPEKFRFPSGVTIELDHSLTKVALAHLGSIWTSSIQFDELMDLSAKKYWKTKELSLKIGKKNLTRPARFLLELYTTGMVELHVHKPNFTREISEFPTASAVRSLATRFTATA